MKRFIILLFFIVSCKKDTNLIPDNKQKEETVFNSEIENSIWVLQEIEFQSQITTYSDTLKFLEDSILVYKNELTTYEFYKSSNDNRELRLTISPVGYIDCQLKDEDISKGKLQKHPFNNVYILSNNYKITLHRIK
jgi:hypothetical protein